MDISVDRLAEQMRRLELLNSDVTYRIARMSKLLEVEAIMRLEGSDLSLNAYRMMIVVSTFGEIAAADVSRLMVLDRAQISRISADLTRRGLLQSRPDASSKLRKLLSLTPAGHRVYDGLKERFSDRQDLIESRLNAEELAVFWTAMEKVTEGLLEKLGPERR